MARYSRARANKKTDNIICLLIALPIYILVALFNEITKDR